MITLEQYLMGRHLEYPKEYTPELEQNAKGLLTYVNDLLKALDMRPALRSGYRPKEINRKVGGSPKSNHIKCLAIDLADPKGELAGKLSEEPELLEEFNLYMEHPKATKGRRPGGGWVHLQSVPPRSGKRIFYP